MIKSFKLTADHYTECISTKSYLGRTGLPEMSEPDEAKNNGGWKAIFKGQGEKKGRARTFSLPKFSISSDKKTETPTVTELPSQELKLELPQLGSETTERVFPVRSMVSYDPNPSSALQTPSLDKLESPIPPLSEAFRRSSLASDNATKQTNGDTNEEQRVTRPDYLSQMHEQSQRLAGMSPSSRVPTLSRPASINDRLLSSNGNSNSHQSTGPYERLHNSISEGAKILKPIRIPKGLQFSQEDEDDIIIQSFGALLVVTLSGDDDFPVEVTSSNTEEIFGIPPDDLFELKSICEIFSETQSRIFRAHADYVLSEEYEVEEVGPEVFCLPTLDGSTQRLWCTMHTSKAYKNYIICELEPEIGGSQQLMDSIDSESLRHRKPRPLSQFSVDEAPQRKSLSNTYDNPSQEADSMDSELLNILPRILKRISSAQSLDVLIQNTISTLQDMTKFHQITVYHFDGDRNGIVVADALEPSRNPESFQGMHFQESTFPDDLKRQYLRDRVAFSYRKGDDVSELVYRVSTNKMALDLSHCYLTATPDDLVSNSTKTSACACMSISIEVFGKLWGLISCQSYDEKLRLHPLLQRASWFIGEAVSSNIERLSYTLPFQVKDQNSPAGESILEDIARPSGDLLGLFGSDYAAASILGKVKILGKPADSQEVLALLEYLRSKEIETVLWSTDLASDFEDLDYSPGFQHLASLLYIPLSANGHDFIVFFRSQPRVNQDNGALDIGSRPSEWSAAEFGKASMLTLLYRTFTEIWQEREVTMQNNQLMRLLLANTAHEFRTPLNAIINYLEIALDSSLNHETRENLSRSHSASKSLVYIINDLLDLTNAENGQKLIKDEVFNLSETLCEATNIFWEEAKQKNVNLQVVQHSELPPVLGDQRRVRQVITNLISNAVQHTSSGAVTIESCIIPEPCEPGYISVEVAIHDTGAGMSQETMETLFCELEQVSNKEYIQKPKSSAGTCDTGSMESSSVLGLGLALVARIVRNMDGQLSLKSEEGTGSCFKPRLKFPLPSEEGANTKVASGGSCGHQACPQKNDTNQAPTESTTEGKSGIPCRCGDDSFPGPGPGQKDSNCLDVEINLTNGESRSITLAAPHSASDKRTKAIEVSDNRPPACLTRYLSQ
jgi:signal transduction histidine kinase